MFFLGHKTALSFLRRKMVYAIFQFAVNDLSGGAVDELRGETFPQFHSIVPSAAGAFSVAAILDSFSTSLPQQASIRSTWATQRPSKHRLRPMGAFCGLRTATLSFVA